MRSTTRSPARDGSVETRTSIGLPPSVSADAAVLRQAPLGDVEPRHHLDAADDQRRDVRRHPQRLAQHAVDPHAHHQPVS